MVLILRPDHGCTEMFPYCLLPSKAPRSKVGGNSAVLQPVPGSPLGVAGGPASVSVVVGVVCPGGTPLSWNPKCRIWPSATGGPGTKVLFTSMVPAVGKRTCPETCVTSDSVNTESCCEVMSLKHKGVD